MPQPQGWRYPTQRCGSPTPKIGLPNLKNADPIHKDGVTQPQRCGLIPQRWGYPTSKMRFSTLKMRLPNSKNEVFITPKMKSDFNPKQKATK